MNMRDMLDPDFVLDFLRQLSGGFLKYAFKLWAVLVFVLALVLGLLPGFQPLLWVNSPTPQADRVVSILVMLYTAWTFMYTGFLQRDVNYSIVGRNSQITSMHSNKNILAYGVAVLMWLVFFVAQQIVGQPATAYMAICAFVQLIPIFLGESFREEMENLMPLLANIMLLVLSIYTVGIGP